jgi:hypothetical protein
MLLVVLLGVNAIMIALDRNEKLNMLDDVVVGPQE